MRRTAPTIQVSSSMTMTPPEPSIEPAQRCSQRQFIVTGFFNMPAQAEDTRSFAFFRPERGIPLGSILDNGRDGREGFTVIDDRGATIESNNRGERWFQA